MHFDKNVFMDPTSTARHIRFDQQVEDILHQPPLGEEEGQGISGGGEASRGGAPSLRFTPAA